jgi:K+-transporting ATPase ATPase C chain
MLLTNLIQLIKTSVILLIIFSLLTGLIYPGLVTAVAQLLFPWRANGSIIERNGQAVGSQLIGQAFTDPAYFWGRPSATAPFPYNAEHSSGSNLGTANTAFVSILKNRIAVLHAADKNNPKLIPVDLVTASGSGLDPDISPEAALYQVTRIANARHISENDVINIITNLLNKRFLSVFGEPKINVLELNLALSSLSTSPKVNNQGNHHER